MRRPPSLCPACGYLMDAVTNTTGKRKPRDGDIGVCLSCGAALVFGADLALRSATSAEVDRLPAELRAALDASVSYIRDRGPLPTRGAKA